MSKLKWKQLNRALRNQAYFTGSLYVTGSFFLDNENIRDIIANEGLFSVTGSYASANKDIKITGSFDVALDGVDQKVTVDVAGTRRIEINEEGVFILKPFSTTPTAVTGGFMYSGSNEFYLGL